MSHFTTILQILKGLDNLCVIVMSLAAAPRDRTELCALGLAAAKFRAEMLGGRGRSYQELRGLYAFKYSAAC